MIPMARIVIITGFESFNASLYRQAAQLAQSRCPGLEVLIFSDRQLTSESEAIALFSLKSPTLN